MPFEPLGRFLYDNIILLLFTCNIFRCVCSHSPLMRNCAAQNMKRTTKDSNSLSTSCLASEDGYKGMKHEGFSSFSLYVKLTSSQHRTKPKDLMHAAGKKKRSISGGMRFLNIIPPEFYTVYEIAQNESTQPLGQHQRRVGYLSLKHFLLFFLNFAFRIKNSALHIWRHKQTHRGSTHSVFEDNVRQSSVNTRSRRPGASP